MKIETCPYELIAKRSLNSRTKKNARKGALLRIHFDDGLTGHADCHPIEELGDLPLNTQLASLKEGQVSPLTAQSLYFARLDAKARAEKHSLFQGLTIPKSHKLFTSIDQVDTQGLIKLKVGRDPKKEAQQIRELVGKPIRLRLDFNASLTKSAFETFLQEIPLDIIDCIEDPFPYDETSWKRLQEKYGVELACDAGSEQAINTPFTLVLKPAIQSHTPFQAITQKLIVTSYMDHPLGQLSAAFIAAKLPTETCGLLTHNLFEPTPFSEQLSQKEGRLIPPEGTGFGFDDLLRTCEWQ